MGVRGPTWVTKKQPSICRSLLGIWAVWGQRLTPPLSPEEQPLAIEWGEVQPLVPGTILPAQGCDLFCRFLDNQVALLMERDHLWPRSHTALGCSLVPCLFACSE